MTLPTLVWSEICSELFWSISRGGKCKTQMSVITQLQLFLLFFNFEALQARQLQVPAKIYSVVFRNNVSDDVKM